MGIENDRSLPAKHAKLHTPRTDKAQRKLSHELEAYQIELEVQNTELRRVQEELEIQQIELEMQNDELRQAQEALEQSRNKYAELYDFAPVGYFTFDEPGVIKDVNLTGAQLLGVERSLLTGKSFSAYIADADGRERFSAHLEAVLNGQGMHKCELGLTGKDGAVIHGLLQSVMVDTLESKTGHVLCSIVDGTVAKRLETEIQDAREYAENIVETVHKPLVVLDSKLKILSVNRSFYETFMVTPEETIGKFIYDLGNRQWDIPKLRVLFEEILPHDSVFNGYEVEHVFPGIGRRFILLNARQIFRKNIGSHIILLAMEDITERAALDQALLDKNVELERATRVAENANRAKSDFLASMSHELRTPLGAILGFAQLLESGKPEPSAAQMRGIDQILKAGWYLLELINGILDLALIESGKLSLSMEPVLLSEVMLECEVMVESQAQERGISVDFIHFKTPYSVFADRTRIKQVLINLLSNAIKYNKTNGTVTVKCTVCGPDSVRISVRDTGEGLTPEQLAQLFQPFNRLGQNSGTEQGTGIGLVVCKRLVELMGGVIGVESTVGEGSLFWFEINRTTELQSSVLKLDFTGADRLPVQGAELKHSLLYIEDNPANLMLVEDLIARRSDIRFLSARNATIGIEIALASLPDLILMDINLPGISGLDALKILSENPKTAYIPVIALSANAVPGDIAKGLEAGFFRYLTKPIKVNEFMDTLDMTLEHAKAEKNIRKKIC
ncbi:MAG: ATP-binding protein [Geobacteraceae bacterium]|nr:ATP-binding protein [Geobacteraceae bacterium]